MTTPQRLDVAASLPPRVRADLASGKIPTVLSDPADALWEAAEDAAERVRRAHATRRARWTARLPRRYAAATLADLDAGQDPNRGVSQWWESTSLTLVLFSPLPGVGKTHAAYAVGNHAVDTGAWAEGWPVIELLAALRPNSADPGALDRAERCDLLVLDDLGRESDSDWTREQMHRILDARLRDGRRQIVTTNLVGAAMGERYSDPLVDRLVDDATIVKVAGQSRREPARWG